MRKILKTFLFLFIGILSLFMNSKVYAYMVSNYIVDNKVTVASVHTDTFIVNYEDTNGNITELGRETKSYFENKVVTITTPEFVNLDNYELDSITINGSGSYSIGSTFTQLNSDMTILYTYISNRPLQTFNVTHNQGNSYNFNGASTVLEGSTYTATAAPSGNRTITNITVTMGGSTLTAPDDYTYTIEDGVYTLTIPNVSGNISINVTTQNNNNQDIPCLVEGTDVTLYDGTTKNIENIKYNDLLKVWNHDTGKYDFEYAGWIEKAGTTDSYTKITFSDGTVLKIVGGHSLFSKRLNKYVDVLSGDLKVGDEVVKLKDGIGYAKITNIETINEQVKYYHVISTRYFNIITNDILTTYEIFSNISNFMEFDSNLKWKNTDIVRSDMYTYDDFTYLPRYIYKAFRLEETKYLVNNGLVSPEQFSYLFNKFLTEENKMLMPPTNENGTRLWMVTTSDDTDPSNIRHQLEEGSTYTVPTPVNTKGFVKWYNSSDNKYYLPGDTIKVYGGMHLTAIYEE